MKSFLKGFVYAGRGIAYCIARERNMRIHLTFTVYMFGFLTVFDFFEISGVSQEERKSVEDDELYDILDEGITKFINETYHKC